MNIEISWKESPPGRGTNRHELVPEALKSGIGAEFNLNEAISFQIHCDDRHEVDRLWARLLEGGTEIECGWIKDRWGLAWQRVPVRVEELLGFPDSERARRSMEAMMKMVKIDIAALERAADGSS